MKDVLSWSGNANMAFDLRLTEDVLPWPGNANMTFDLWPTGDVLPWPGNANIAFDLRQTEDGLPWLDNANMAFDLWPTGDVLPWPGNANMAFGLRQTEDGLPWPGSANMAFGLRQTKDGLLWPGSANMADYVLREIHAGSCSMHSGPRFVVARALRSGYYWPTMHRDARDVIKKCSDCQVHRPIPRLPQQQLTPITSPWPFYKWGIDMDGRELPHTWNICNLKR
nr:reverse transcriptase domain-containing protein [Tanacetum cinerariifolium]